METKATETADREEKMARLNMEIAPDIKAALDAEARINFRQTGPHCAKILTDYIERKRVRMANGAR